MPDDSTETYLLQTDCRVSEKTNTNDNYLISIQLRHDFCKNKNGDFLLNLTIKLKLYNNEKLNFPFIIDCGNVYRYEIMGLHGHHTP